MMLLKISLIAFFTMLFEVSLIASFAIIFLI